MDDDRKLLAAWAGGDRDSGTAFYRRYAERVTRFFVRKLDADTADLVQRTFLKILEAEKNGTEIRSVGGLLFAIARSQLYDELRRRHRDAGFEPEVTSLADLGTSPSQALARNQRQRLLLAALRRIPLAYQIALELYYWEELSMAEVAEALGITRSAALSRVHRARQMLRDALDELPAPARLITETIKDFEAWVKGLEDAE